jgi:hypothetical protein
MGIQAVADPLKNELVESHRESSKSFETEPNRTFLGKHFHRR